MNGSKILLIIVGIIICLLLIEGVRLLLLKNSVNTYKNYWQAQNAKAENSEGLLYVALGDSTGQGIGATSPERGYVGLIAQQLKAQHDAVRVINLSVSGAKVQDVLNHQIPQLEKITLSPESIVTIEVGANDVGSWDEAAFRSNMDRLMSQLPSQTVISDIPYFGGGRKRGLEPHVLVANNIIQDLAVKYKLRLAPLHEVTKERDSLLTMSSDLLHPSNTGYRNWFEAFRRALGI